jgi:peptide/nickel transport system substrate-binding protein
MRRTRRTPLILAAVVLLTLLTGCASLQSSATEIGGVRTIDGRPAKDGGTLTVALASDPDKLDPTLASTLVGRTVFAAMCEKLYDIDEKGKIVPQLATALPTTSADGRTLTIPIRRDAKFSDGTRLDAAAVVTSLLRHRNLPTSSRATELAPLSGVQAIGPYTVRITLKQPYTPLLGVLADRAGMVMSPAALKKYGVNFDNHPSCVGAFRFVERVGGDRIVLEKDPHYYDADKVHLDRVIYKAIPDGSVRLANLRSGDVQVGDQMAPIDVQSSLTESKLQLFNSPSLGYQALEINIGNVNGEGKKPGKINTPLATDVRIREAFDLSLDRDVINKVVFQGLYEPACGPVSPGSAIAPGVPPDKCPKRDVPKAKQLLRAAGVKTPFPMQLLVPNTPDSSRLGQVVQAMAKEAGFDVSLKPTEFTTLLDESAAGDYQAVAQGWSGRLDPDGNIASFLQTAGAQNDWGISDPAIDRLIDQGRAEADPAKRAKIYEELTTLVNEQHSLIYLYRQRNYVVASTSVAGVRVYSDGLVRINTAGYAR